MSPVPPSPETTAATRKWARLKRPGGPGLRRGAWYIVLDDGDRDVVTVDVNRQSVAVDRSLLEITSHKPHKWSVVRWNPRDDEAKLAAQANLGPTYGVCPNCRGRANLDPNDTQRKCPVCELLFEIDWGSSC
ncbi:MAG TPA: hypothetical protein VNL18_11785 [Gemmatimonadales bacterium]|nr:hypothetical protein [Gemmatimonadales bacterium]